MTIHVTPHEGVEHEGAWVNAAKTQIKERAIAKKRREFLAANADGEAIIAFIAEKAFAWASDNDWYRAGDNCRNFEPRNFFDKIHLSVIEWGAPTQGQADAVRKIIAQQDEKKAQWAARDARSAHIGKVGDKIEVDATVYFQTEFEGAFGYVTITGFRAGDDIIIHKGTAPKVDGAKQERWNSYYCQETNKWIQTDFKREVAKGDKVVLKGTVKSHGDRDGVKQTIITRPKTTLIEEAA